MMQNAGYAEDFFAFLQASPTAFHAAAEIGRILQSQGFCELQETEPWTLHPGGRYFVTRNGSAVIAFVLPQDYTPRTPARMVVSHLDSPALRLKLRGLTRACQLQRVEVTPYGGPILNSWFDRPLDIAGRLLDPQTGTMRLLHLPAAAMIASLASHLAPRDERGTTAVNPQTEMQALLELEGTELPELLQTSGTDWLEPELLLVDGEPPRTIGKGGMFNASRLDNLSSAYPQLRALCQAAGPSLAVAFFADNEEIGNQTPQGAASCFLEHTLRRIQLAAGHSSSLEDYLLALSRSFVVSFDAAHALHPNYAGRYDLAYAPLLGQGVAVKTNAQGRYCFAPAAVQALQAAAKAAEVKLQFFMNRADLPCGTTVGPVTTCRLGCPGVDIGVPMLAMHSIRETAALQDIQDAESLLQAFFSGR